MTIPTAQAHSAEGPASGGRPAFVATAAHSPAPGPAASPSLPDPIAAEQALLARLRAGDEAAFDQLVRQLAPRLLLVARRFAPSHTDAEDALQDAFLSAFKSLPTFDGRSTLSTWLHRIVINAALSRARKTGARRESSLDALLPTFENGRHVPRPAPWRAPGASAGLPAELSESLRTALATLPDDHREALLLKDVQGLPSADIAVALGISDALARQRIHRARQALMKLLAPALQESSQ